MNHRRTSPPPRAWTRREFVVGSGAAALAAAASPSVIAAMAHPAGSDTIRVGVIGCGGRGTGAAENALEADPGTIITALADLYPERVEGCRKYLSEHEDFASRAAVPAEACFTGFDAYRRLLESGLVDMVILATAPGFRPLHFEAAVAAGMHVFMEKPVAVDAPGVRRVIEAARRASEQKLSVVAGTQRRHERSYLAAIDQLRAGIIGDIVAARCYWNQGGLWVHERKPEYSDMEWQTRNWLYFCWTSGDHICEQHIHNLDVINWALDATPIKCVGVGGRQSRTEEKYGNIFDHFSIEYEYPRGIVVHSMCRQIEGTPGRCEEVFTGTRGTLITSPGRAEATSAPGDALWKFSGENPSPYTQEHIDLFASIRNRRAVNEARRVAESTLTAIMGRMAAYTGQEITWDQALNSKLDLSPARYDFGPNPVAPTPTPGKTKFE